MQISRQNHTKTKLAGWLIAANLLGLVLLPASSAHARTVNLVLPQLACDDSRTQKALHDFEREYGEDVLRRQQAGRIRTGRCIWLDAGFEAEVESDDGDDQVCLALADFPECMWVMKEAVE